MKQEKSWGWKMGKKKLKLLLVQRIAFNEAHYAGNLVDGSRIDQLIGDAATRLLIEYDGDEGLFRARKTEYLKPVYGGDYLEVYGRITKVGNTSRHMEFEVYKIITNAKIPNQPSAFDALEKKVLVAKCEGVCVTPKECQRKKKK